MSDLILQEKVLKNKSLILHFHALTPFVFWPIWFIAVSYIITNVDETRQYLLQLYSHYTVFFNLMIVFTVIGMVLYLRIAFNAIKQLRKIQVNPDGLTIIHQFKENQFVSWEEIKTLKLINSPSRPTNSYQGFESHSWKIDTSIEPKLSFTKKAYNFYITSTHEQHKDLLALISEKTGLEVEKPKKPPRKPNIPTWTPGSTR